MKFLKQNLAYILFIAGIIFLIVLNKDVFMTQHQMTTQEQILIDLRSTTTSLEQIIYVEIKGEVQYPGVYQVKEGTRIGDVIELAGGFTEDANQEAVSLVDKAEDEMVIIIPSSSKVDDYTDLIRILVEVKGEVKRPGLYYLYTTSRVQDAIEAAGGISEYADLTVVNLARILKDGETIIIPKIQETTTTQTTEQTMIYVEITGEVNQPGVYYIPESYTLEDLIYEAGGVTTNCDLEKINWSIKLVLGASINIPGYQDDLITTQNNGLVNINTADLETLITLPGIGNILGQRIIDYRTEYGSFQSIEDIMLVSGIKDSIYEQVKDLITV